MGGGGEITREGFVAVQQVLGMLFKNIVNRID
jgi:hypothetical protein